MMRKLKGASFGISMMILSLAVIGSIIATSCLGAVQIPVEDTFRILAYHLFDIQFPETEALIGTATDSIIWSIRFPRILMGVAAGVGLSLCGVAMQATVQNPLAEPYILGISSGASLFATFSIFLGFGGLALLNISAVSLWSFLGALAASAAVIFLSSAGGKITSTKLILSGSIINALCTAFSNFIITIAADAEGMMTLKFWTMGSLTKANWNNIWFPLVTVVALWILYQLLSRPLNVLLMGDEAAITLGINLSFYRGLFLTTASLVTGILVASCGVIGFVGLIIPHIVRAMVGADHRRLIPVSALGGALFLLWSDAFARILIPNTELPISILTSVVGAPVFVFIMLKNNYQFRQ